MQYFLVREDHILTEEQMELADIDGKTHESDDDLGGRSSIVNLSDSLGILIYYTDSLAYLNGAGEMDIVDYMKAYYPYFYE